MKKRPVVLISALCLSITYAVLLLPAVFVYIFSALLVGAVLCSGFFLSKKQLPVYCIFAAIVVLSALNPYLRYMHLEKPSTDFTENVKLKENAVYTATVDECRTYPSFSQMFVTITSVDGEEIKPSPKARLGCYSRAKLDTGDTVVFSGSPIELSEIEETDFDTSTYLRSKCIFMDFPSVTLISSSPAKSTPLLTRLSNYTQNIIYKFIPENYNYDTASVCLAMFTGNRDSISSDIKESFSESGITHILCVSGMHLAILTGGIYFLLTALSVHKKLKCVLIIAICIFYTAFTGFSLSTVRACIMCSVGYFGMMLGKKTDGYISLFLSLFIICTVSPYSVFDISLLLSFSATLGIICMSEFSPTYDGKNPFIRMIYGLLGSIYCNVGAAFFTLPICAFFFKEFSVMSIISTLIVSVFVGFLLISLLILVIISPLSNISAIEFLVFGAGEVCNLVCRIIIKCADFFSHFRYSYGKAILPQVHLFLFILMAILLALFIAFDIKIARHFCLASIIVLSIVFSFMSLTYEVIDDAKYKVTYYRKNENDRQISLKLGKHGYILINADSNLCTDIKHAPFDKKFGQNYLFIIPDTAISMPVLAENIRIFDKRFGIKRVFIPEGFTDFAKQLEEEKIKCSFLPNELSVGNFEIIYTCNGSFYISISDKSVKTDIFYGDSYSKDAFGDNCNICAFFTRKTKNQFRIDSDTIPDCDVFFTRLKKNEAPEGIINTFGEKTVIIKG